MTFIGGQMNAFRTVISNTMRDTCAGSWRRLWILVQPRSSCLGALGTQRYQSFNRTTETRTCQHLTNKFFHPPCTSREGGWKNESSVIERGAERERGKGMPGRSEALRTLGRTFSRYRPEQRGRRYRIPSSRSVLPVDHGAPRTGANMSEP